MEGGREIKGGSSGERKHEEKRKGTINKRTGRGNKLGEGKGEKNRSRS